MRTVTRRALALLLCLMLCISALPAALAAEDLEEVVDLEETALPAEPEEIPAEPVEILSEEPAASGEWNGLLYEITEENTVTITGYTDMAALPADLVIPDVIEGYPVTAIGENAFANLNIGTLRSVSLPEGLKNIYNYAFWASGVESVTLPESLQTIGMYAFSECPLTTVRLGKNVCSVGIAVFEGCAQLTRIDVDGDNAWFCSDERGVLFDKNMTVLREAPGAISGDYQIPEGVTNIAVGAFSHCAGLESVALAESTEAICSNAFDSCTGLKSVTFSEAVNLIDPYAFAFCTALTAVELPENLYWLRDSAFYGCSGLESVVFAPGILERISAECFDSCTSLKTVHIPDNVIGIEDCAFLGCDALTDVYYGGSDADWENVSVSPNGNDALLNSNIRFAARAGEKNGLTYKIDNETGLVTITGYSGDLPAFLQIPATIEGCPVTAIGTGAFNECLSLRRAELPDGLRTIDTGAFSHCANMTEVVIPGTVTEIREHAFLGCRALGSVTIPAGVTVIESGAFLACESLTEITVPEGVVCIEEAAFSLCTRLEKVDLPTTLTAIGREAFADCRSLTDVTIPQNVAVIPGALFRDCGALASVSLPAGVTVVEDGFISGCTALSDIYFGGSLKQWCAAEISEYEIEDEIYYNKVKVHFAQEDNDVVDSGAFGGLTWTLYNDCRLIVTGTGEMQFTEGSPWKGYRGYIRKAEIGSGVTTVCDAAFISCYVLTEAVLSDTVTAIGSGAFLYCSDLTGIELSESVTSIGSSAFSLCSSLTEITIPAGVTVIDFMAFDLCNNLSTVIFRGDAPAIEDMAFDGVTADMWYPAQGNWPASALQDYSGHLTWHPYSDSSEIVDSQPVSVTGVSLTLKGQIGIYIYAQMPENAATARLTYPKTGEVKEYTLDKNPNYYVEKTDQYKFLYENVPAKEMTMGLELEVFDAQGKPLHIVHAKTGERFGTRFSCRAVDYCNTILADPNQKESLKDLVKAILNYGQCAQIQFDFATDYPANPKGYLADEMRTVVPDAANDQEIPANAADVGWEYGTLTLKGAVSANLYFSKQITAKDANGKSYTVKAKSGKWCITFDNIPAKNLGDKYTVIASYGGKSATIKYSALSYINAVLAQEDTDSNANLKQLCKAIILYNKYAKAYFGN